MEPYKDNESNKQKVELNQIVIYFEFDSDAIDISQYSKLNKAVEILKSNPDFEVILMGHTDTTGDQDYNAKLSYRRAQNVLKYFSKKGVNTSKIDILAQGALQPVSKASDLNRRVEIKVR